MHIRIIPFLITIMGLIFALYVGTLVGHSSTKILAIIFGGISVLSLCLWLRSRIWLLIPLCWELTGRISVLPLPFSVRDLSVMLVTVMFGIFYALKMVRLKSESGWLEVLVAINIAYVVSMFIRHPVGTSAFGSEMVGGRPYFDVAIALLAFLLLRAVSITPKQARVFPVFLLAAPLMVTGLNLIVRRVPALVAVIAPFYSGINVQGYMEAEGYQAASAQEGQRFTELVGPSSSMIQLLCSYYNPFSLLLPIYPIRMALLLIAAAGILYSGYRNAIMGAVLFFLCASYFKGGTQALIRAFILGFVVLLALIIVQVSIGLPVQAQRSLSFIPLVHWNEQAKEDAEGSTQWRVEMWKIVLNEKKYINDKIWGDGFGFSAYEYQIMRDADFGGTGFIGAANQESYMINGTFHSGPLSSIRYAGVVGLILFMSLSIYLSFQAPALINQARGTPYFTTTIYFFASAIFGPLFFIFIFGAYDASMVGTLFQAGVFRMLRNSLQNSQAEKVSVSNNPTSIDERLVLAHRS